MFELLEDRTGHNDNTFIYNAKPTSCLKECINEITISQEDFVQQLLHQRNKTGEINENLTAKIESDNTLMTV